MTTTGGANALVRAVGLLADGPVGWGTTVRSTSPGVFIVELPNAPEKAPIDIGIIGTWLSHVQTLRVDGARPTGKELAARLGSFWLPGEPVLYVGRSSTSLAGRVNATYRTPLGDAKPHAGGHWLKTLTSLRDTRVWWAETAATEEAELALLEAFATAVGDPAAIGLPAGSPVLPFANLALPTGERRVHGISGSFRAEAGGVAPPSTAPTPRSQVAPAARAGGGGRATSRPVAPRPKRPKVTAPTAAQARAAEPVHLTADGLAALDAELTHLRGERRPTAIARVAAARELGDLSENAEYHAAREELGFIEGRIRSLEHRRKRAVVVVGGDGERAAMGSVVVVESDGERTTYTLVSSAEARPAEGRISVSSPVGAAIVGASPGDEVVVRSPAGEHRLRVVAID